MVMRALYISLHCSAPQSFHTLCSHSALFLQKLLVMSHYSCIFLLLAALLMLWYGARQVDAAPTFGLLLRNGTTTLLTDILQAKINALEILADYIAIAGTASG